MLNNGIFTAIRNDSGDSFFTGTPAAINLYTRQPDINKAEPIIKVKWKVYILLKAKAFARTLLKPHLQNLFHDNIV